MKIFVLGHTGMLGRYVSTYLSQFYHVINVGRNTINASKTNLRELDMDLEELILEKDDVIINCIGTIKPRVDELGDLNAIQVNSVFPRLLAMVSEKRKAHLIHPTTDCVYSGNKGQYTENDKYYVSDVYGMSKAMGEPNNCTVIRTSIIGEEIGQGRSLVEWVKSSNGKTVNGYTNHYWNGITCLQFAKVCKQIVETGNYWSGVKHLYSNVMSKAVLVETISNVYNLDITITHTTPPISCDRSLSTIYPDNLESFNIPTLFKQIMEMKKFNKLLNGVYGDKKMV